MIGSRTTDKSNIAALLCVGDVGGHASDPVMAMQHAYGQPYLHHIIKMLQSAGVTRFFIGLDSVPGALLSYRDMARSQGLDVQFVRDPSELLSHVDGSSRILVMQADTYWNDGLITKLLDMHRPLIATVEERAENQMFERIDLNNRWSGVAVLERNTLQALPQMPEGWDMASALLRQAVQDRIEIFPIRQVDIQSGSLRKLQSAADLVAVLPRFWQRSSDANNSFEMLLFSQPAAKLTPMIWLFSKGRAVAEWLSFALAVSSMVLAAVGWPVFAVILSVMALFSAMVRKNVHIAEYRAKTRDWIMIAACACLAAALFLVLQNSEFASWDTGFFWFCLTGLMLRNGRQDANNRFNFLTPLTVSIVMLIGISTDSVSWLIKFAILTEIALLVVTQGKAKARTSISEQT